MINKGFVWLCCGGFFSIKPEAEVSFPLSDLFPQQLSHKIRAETLIRQVKLGEHPHGLTTPHLKSNKTQGEGEGKIFRFLKAHGEFQQLPLTELSTACFQ